jgi:hypothetical protein
VIVPVGRDPAPHSAADVPREQFPTTGKHGNLEKRATFCAAESFRERFHPGVDLGLGLLHEGDNEKSLVFLHHYFAFIICNIFFTMR